MNERFLEQNFWESLDALKKSGCAVELLAVPHTGVGKSEASFLSTVKEVTIKLTPPADWGMRV